MSSVNPVSAALGGLGLLSQYGANQQAENGANQQLALQQQLIGAQIGARNNYLDQVGALGEQGAFNPAQQTFDALHAGQTGLTNALNSQAGAARALGYRPGDTVPLTELNQTQGNFQLQQAGLENQIAQQSRANYLAAEQGAPSLSDLGSGIAATGENARMFESQDMPLGGMLGALAPYLQGQGNVSGVAAQGNPYYGQSTQLNPWLSSLNPNPTYTQAQLSTSPFNSGINTNLGAYQSPAWPGPQVTATQALASPLSRPQALAQPAPGPSRPAPRAFGPTTQPQPSGAAVPQRPKVDVPVWNL